MDYGNLSKPIFSIPSVRTSLSPKCPRLANLCHLYMDIYLFVYLFFMPNLIIRLSCLGPQSGLSLNESNFSWQVLPAGGCSWYLHQKGRFSQRFYFNMKSVLQPEPLLGDVPKFMSAA